MVIQKPNKNLCQKSHKNFPKILSKNPQLVFQKPNKNLRQKSIVSEVDNAPKNPRTRLRDKWHFSYFPPYKKKMLFYLNNKIREKIASIAYKH